ncbi:MAG: hypothetical protein LBB42_04680 [Coriobacteriales bacterium]|jgi:hypothetical protein|nr:hypothetical protein [Coriobacteriales bacterium]
MKKAASKQRASNKAVYEKGAKSKITSEQHEQLEQLEQLTKMRTRTTTATLAVFVLILVGLAGWRFVSDNLANTKPLGYALEMIARAPTIIGEADDETVVSERSKVDSLGIASNELVFERSSDDGLILWYSTAKNRTQSAQLVDQALVSQGWVSCSNDEQTIDAYERSASSANTASYAMVLYYEFGTGCSVIVEVV